MVVVAEATDGAGAGQFVRDANPDVVLMDVRMPRVDGVRATADVVSNAPGVKVIILTTFDLDEHVLESLRVGASGFLLKDTPRAELLRAIRVVADGDALLTPGATRRLLDEFVRGRPRRPTRPASDALTPREREVLVALAKGLSNAEIAARYVISEHTVKTHIGSILAKLGLRDRVQAVIYAFEAGLV
jgi:DNA-binding NarL/FixJ family response regulator